jgi:TPR repeat protein
MYLTAFNYALPRAQQGDSAAQTLIAELYEKGLGIRKDTKQAAAWYEIAAESGNREAQFSFAVKLLKGVDVTLDKERGTAMMARAADAGHPVAMFNQAHQIVRDRPTSAGYRKALPLFETAAEYGVGDSYYSLSQIYKQGLADGVQNPDKARYWLVRAARAGVDTAQIELAISLANGTDGPQDEALAVSWFTIAANGGNVIAQNRLAHLLAKGIGTNQNSIEAAKWHILAQRSGRSDLQLDAFMKSMGTDQRAKALVLANKWPLSRP